MALRLTRTDERMDVRDDDLTRYDDQIVEVDPDVTYTIRSLRPSDVQRLRQPYITYAFDPKTRKRVENEIAPDQAEALALDLIDHVVVGWTGVLDGDAEAACTRENKSLLDPRRRSALVRVATVNQVQRAEDRAASFRATAGVGGMDGAHGRADVVLPDGPA